MGELVLPVGSLGKSSLFDTGDGSENVSDDDLQFISHNGSTLFIKKKQDTAINYAVNDVKWEDDDSYGININSLLDKIELKNSDRVTKTSKADNISAKRGKPTKLWVEKWRPKTFLELVGNEKTNRRILKWLRDWSPLVFKEQLPKMPLYVKDEEFEPDPLLRPRKKILLIHGPPGIGKTSVAHVVCKQAGFSVTEINASDERAGQIVKDKVHNTLFNKTLHSKPVCLVADEVDGSVESGFVKVLIDIINKDIRATNKLRYTMNTNSKLKTKNKKSINLLTRPIIAICNNIYAPALEKLKPFCEIVSFRRPSDNALQERLVRICEKEHLDFPIKTINELIDLAQGDIRNCINNLQFMATHNKAPGANITDKSNDEWKSSNKDTVISWFHLVNKIFKKDSHKDIKEQFYTLLHQIEMNGNYDRILQGCFTLFPSVKYSDSGVRKASEITDWLYFHDLMLQSLYKHNGELMRYSSVVPLVFFQKFGDVANKEDVRVKNMEFELREAKRSNVDIVNLVMTHLSSDLPAVAAFVNKNSLIFDILPYLDYMISSDLSRIKNLKMKGTIVDALLKLLQSFQLELVQTQHDLLESKSVLSINPPVDKVVLLDPQRIKDITTKRPVNYSLLLAKLQEDNVKKRHFSQTLKEKRTFEENKNKKQKISTNTMEFFKNQYDTMKNNQQSEISSVNSVNTNNNDNTSNLPVEKSRIWVKYKAGFSNAVRKNVSWNGLWQ